MDLLIGAANAAVIAAMGLFLAWVGKGRFEALERSIAELGHELRDEFRGETGDIREEIRPLRTSIDAMRSDLTQVALAVGVRRRAENE